MSDDLRTPVLLSMQRALWDHVTPDLRGVAVEYRGELDRGAHVAARFLYEGDVGPLQRECVAESETYFLADFLPDMSSEFEAVDHAERDLQGGEMWVFLRWEPTPETPINRTDMPRSARDHADERVSGHRP
ncbi:hypothetical protein ABN028_34815 [Actinopolymorpha sp. B17G11]|uniref:hypothetical protein n=1 Tax=Actinopolymorpha sp. B17G11 TaxID=3160861 RepID=UPI0032E38243